MLHAEEATNDRNRLLKTLLSLQKIENALLVWEPKPSKKQLLFFTDEVELLCLSGNEILFQNVHCTYMCVFISEPPLL